jgi:hypothetical protein
MRKKRELDSYAVNLCSPSKKKSNSSYIAPSAVAYYVVQGCDVGYIAVFPQRELLVFTREKKGRKGRSTSQQSVDWTIQSTREL